VDQRRFGTDLSLEPSGGAVRDLRVIPPGDLAVVHGPDAAVQALTLSLLVRRGELAALGWPDFGSRLHELVGELDTPRTRIRLAQYAREAVAGDWRVTEVTQVTVATDRFEARVVLDVLLAGQPDEPLRLAVAVPIETS
jgi:hypothetical protein